MSFKRNMELKLLQSQINPHFLYNTLDNIMWLAEDGKTTENKIQRGRGREEYEEPRVVS